MKKNIQKVIRVLNGSEISSPTAYLYSYLRKLESRFRNNHISELPKYEITLNEILTSLFKEDLNKINKLEIEFLNIKNNLNEYLDMVATADLTLSKLLYFICRKVKPLEIMETGVWHGVSSTFILSAIDKNKSGFLYSIDLPPVDPSIKVEIGGAIPNDLKKNWDLNLGHSSLVLPEVLNKTLNLEIFIHDSEHTYRNMIVEFKTVWPFLKKGGYLISDDVSLNDAFYNFGKIVKRDPCIIKREKGGYIGFYIK